MRKKLWWLSAVSLVAVGIVWGGVAAALAQEAESAEVWNLNSLPTQGIKELKGYRGQPDQNGVLKTWQLVLPKFERACFFSGIRGNKGDNWPVDSNQILPWIIGGEFRELLEKKGITLGSKESPASRHGLELLLKLPGGETMALLPIAGPKTLSWLEVDSSGQLLLRLGTLGSAPVSCDAPLLAWARGPDVYANCRQVWDSALRCDAAGSRTTWRDRKKYPEAFLYLGWCSWEQYKKNIDEKVLLAALDGIEASGLPIRWFLVDDGHQTQSKQQLISFSPDAKQFPHGWAPILARRSPQRIRWMGLWHCFDGLWKQIDSENQLGPLNECLMPLPPAGKSALIVKDGPPFAQKFFDAYMGSVKQYGFDFVKIDVQSQDLKLRIGHPNAVEASAAMSQALEAASQRDMQGLINCMAQNAVCVFNTRHSAVTRCSIDYKLGDADRGKSHLQESYHNTLWLGQTVWPDHDEFHSCDPYCGRMMAVSKALSGAPVYLSDDPKQFVVEYIKPLCLSDGELLRPLAPAVPLADSVFCDGLGESAAYRVIAPLANGCAAVAVYNLRRGQESATIDGQVTAADYAQASGMLQPYPGPWKVPSEGLVVFDFQEGKGRRLDKPYRFDIKGFNDRLLLVCPISQGWAVVGRADKYLAPAAVQRVSGTPDRLDVSLVESGPLVVWTASGEPQVKGVKFVELGDGFWKADLPAAKTKQPTTIVITKCAS